MTASRRTTQRTPIRAALAAGLLLCTGAGVAQAQYVYDDELLPPRVVAWRLSERGFSGLSRPRFDGRSYVVEAFAPNGARVRLFVDAREGDIVGRQRLDAPVYAAPPIRVARPVAPGYGWTEEDDTPSRPIRQAERLVPPADIPYPGTRAVPPPSSARISPAAPEPTVRRAELPARPDAGEANPLGVNPDAHRRPAEPPRKAAKLAPPAKPATPRVSPEAPAPKITPAEPAPVAARSEPKPVEAAKPDASKSEAPKPDTAKANAPKTEPTPTPASVQPPPAEAATEAKTIAEAKKSAESWKDPPAEKRAVRVIGGATIVPGADAAKGEATHTE